MSQPPSPDPLDPLTLIPPSSEAASAPLWIDFPTPVAPAAVDLAAGRAALLLFARTLVARQRSANGEWGDPLTFELARTFGMLRDPPALSPLEATLRQEACAEADELIAQMVRCAERYRKRVALRTRNGRITGLEVAFARAAQSVGPNYENPAAALPAWTSAVQRIEADLRIAFNGAEWRTIRERVPRNGRQNGYLKWARGLMVALTGQSERALATIRATSSPAYGQAPFCGVGIPVDAVACVEQALTEEAAHTRRATDRISLYEYLYDGDLADRTIERESAEPTERRGGPTWFGARVRAIRDAVARVPPPPTGVIPRPSPFARFLSRDANCSGSAAYGHQSSQCSATTAQPRPATQDTSASRCSPEQLQPSAYPLQPGS